LAISVSMSLTTVFVFSKGSLASLVPDQWPYRGPSCYTDLWKFLEEQIIQQEH